MKDLSERLWPAFRGEVAEQLEALELLMVRRGGASADEINAMFRHFHTIKGGCAMMGYANMGALAHAAEDAMDPVRRGQRLLDDALLDILLATVDALKQQLHASERDRRDPPPQDALVEQLRGSAQAMVQQPVQSAVQTATPGNADPELAAKPKSGGRKSAAQTSSAQSSKGSTAKTSASSDTTPDAMSAFAAVGRKKLVEVLAAVLDDAALEKEALDKTALAALRELTTAARAAGLIAVAQLFARAAAASADVRRCRLAVAEACDRLASLESESGLDSGLQQAAARVRAPGELQVQLLLRSLNQAMARVVQEPEQALADSEDMLALSWLLHLPQTSRLLRLVTQVLRDATHRGLHLDDALQELLLLAVQMPADLQTGLVEDAPYAAMCGALYQRLQAAAAEAASGRDLGVLRQRIRDVADIRGELLETLAVPALERLAAALERGDTVVEIEADMESAADNGAAFIAWLDERGLRLGNQTVFHREVSEGSLRETTSLRFLAALPMPLAAIRAELGRLDPQQRLFTVTHCLSRTSSSNETADGIATAAPSESAAGVAGTANAVASGNANSNAGAGSGNSPAGGTGSNPEKRSSQTLRVDSEVVDQFVNRVGELVTLRNMMAHALQADELTLRHRRLRTRLGTALSNQNADIDLDDLRQLLSDLDERFEQLQETDLRMQGALGRIQEDVLALRVVPIAVVFNRLPRVVRDLSQSQQKKVNLDVVGEDVRVDKSLVDVLLEPLMHLVRNALDHGIEVPAKRRAAGKAETATLTLSARQQGGTLVVEVHDDGRGLDLDRIRQRALDGGLLAARTLDGMTERELANLIFLPGFSTAETVTEVSGRGVGMDVVKTRIAQIGGQVDVRTRTGLGTTFTLKLPLSVAIQSVILVAAGAREFAIPERNVEEIISLPVTALQSVQGQACCLLRGATLPVYSLAALLGHAETHPTSEKTNPASAKTGAALAEIVVLGDGVYRVGIRVTHVLGRPEVFVRDVHPDIARLPGVGGVSVLGNGQVVIILDCEKLFELALRSAQTLRSLVSAS